MTNKEISNRPILTLDGKNKAEKLVVEDRPTLKDETIKNNSAKANTNVISPADEKSVATKTKTSSKHNADLEPEYDFNVVYDQLHTKFPEIINMDKPVLLAIAIRSRILKEASIPNAILNKWIGWYFRKSNYYSMHEIGAMRYNLDGSEAGSVTEKDQAKRDKTARQS